MQATSRLKGLDVNQPDLHAFVSFLFVFFFFFFAWATFLQRHKPTAALGAEAAEL